MVDPVLNGHDFTACGKTRFKGKKCQGTTLVQVAQNKDCHPERTGPQALFSLGVVSRKPALSEAEGDLLLFLKEHPGHHTGGGPHGWSILF
jgi:hypothetical protein